MSGGLKMPIKQMKHNCIVITLLLCTLLSCKNNAEKKSYLSPPGGNEMADLNRYLIKKDRERIQNYIERKNLRMTETQTGLWYQIIKEGEGASFRDNDKIILDYDCSLLDGTKCYSSKELGSKVIVLGKSEVEAGLNEGLRLLNPGAEAIFIIPPFLAYGLVGDRKLIPPRTVIVYNVTARIR
jgi:FKBP-type peptidyl-prolyl cis-trans isomerase FkpA